jgi:D-alanyl-D-alanine carboxypeptidase
MSVFKQFLAFFLAFLMIFPLFSLNIVAKSDGIGKISAQSAILIEAESGKVLYEKNAEKRMPMASTTKIMTAILAIECGISLDTVIKIPKDAVGIEGSSIYLKEGETISLEELIYGLLLCSANDAAIAIAITVASTTENFVDLMNQKAASLGLCDTHFANPHGLHDENHYTTAKDLAILMAYCVKNPIFLNISGCEKKIFASNDASSRVMINHNRLLRSYSGVIAGKTGYTKASGRCLVSCAERDGLRLIAVTLNAPNDWQDHTNLFDFGFESYRIIRLDCVYITLPVASGSKNELVARADGTSLFLPKSSEEISVQINAPRFVFAPVNKGDKVGEVVYNCQGKTILTLPLLATETIRAKKYKFNPFSYLIDLIKGFFTKWKK